MVEYILFGKTVSFNTAAERFFEMQQRAWIAEREAAARFSSWYDSAKSIETVLNGYEAYSNKLLWELVVSPLFGEVTKYEIYDISKERFADRCSCTEHRASALEEVETQYFSILDQQEAEEAYREARKAGRSRWQGGGFGLSGAIKGAAQAGALNAVSGLGHSLVNAVGNASSAAASSAAKQNLYQSIITKNTLSQGLTEDLLAFFTATTSLINEYKSNAIRSTFNIEKSNALFENAKNIPEKRNDLLVQAFTWCPWNKDLIKYIFLNCPTERKAIYAAARRFGVDLADTIEAALSREYSGAARQSDEAAKRAKAKIIAMMREYGMASSKTLDLLEYDCLSRLCPNYETASESTCNSYITAIKNYDASPLSKELFLKKLQERIETIWASEDGEIFDNLYYKTDLTDPSSIEAAIQYIKSKDRSSSAEKYLKALEGCDAKKIEKARICRMDHRTRIYDSIAIACIFTFLLNIFLIHAGFLAGATLLIIAFAFFGLSGDLQQAWNLLTINETVLHPAVTQGIPEPKKKVPVGLWSLPLTAIMAFILRFIASF